jgi:hypothetical protein
MYDKVFPFHFRMKLVGSFAALCVVASLASPATSQFSEDDAREFVDSLDAIFCDAGNAEMTARWNYITDITPEHEEEMVNKCQQQ